MKSTKNQAAVAGLVALGLSVGTLAVWAGVEGELPWQQTAEDVAVGLAEARADGAGASAPKLGGGPVDDSWMHEQGSYEEPLPAGSTVELPGWELTVGTSEVLEMDEQGQWLTTEGTLTRTGNAVGDSYDLQASLVVDGVESIDPCIPPTGESLTYSGAEVHPGASLDGLLCEVLPEGAETVVWRLSVSGVDAEAVAYVEAEVTR